MSEKILEILREMQPYEDIDEDSRLIEDGIIDSMMLVLLISELESAFGLKIPEDRLQPKFFETVPVIEKLLRELA